MRLRIFRTKALISPVICVCEAIITRGGDVISARNFGSWVFALLVVIWRVAVVGH